METLNFLVVDDDHLFRNRLVQALLERGFPFVEGAECPLSAISTLRSKSVERVILDLRMGSDSGLQVLEHIQRTAYKSEVILLTGYGSIATATYAIKAGAKEVLTKPATVDQILSVFEGLSNDAAALSEHVPSLSQVEWEHIQRVMADNQGNISKAAKALGMHRRSLQRKLQKQPGILY